jgi:outer membrane receptor for ferrienterochelin and colicins
MVLVDGQPMLGRNSGNFDLSRISVTNIERIEIIKGASSCLYGSDALGGAINIITRHGAITPQAQASLLYGSLNTVDATLEAETPFANQRGSAVFFGQLLPHGWF